MLGGSFWVAFIRNGIGAGLITAVFLLLDRPRFSLKKTACCYALFGLAVVVSFSIWYVIDQQNYIRFAGILAIPVIGIFCLFMSGETIYLSLYKMALGFYMLAVTVFCGIDASRMWFGASMWADIALRIVMCFVILVFITRKIRKSFLEGADILEEEMDLFSMAALLVSIVIAAMVALWPSDRTFSPFNISRTMYLFAMAGLIQYMMFRMYLHQGREHRYQIEKELMEMNEQLLRRQLEMMKETEEESIRIRHDIRHHFLLIEEYIKNGENEKLLSYVRQYREDLENRKRERICSNETVNSILSAYGRYAQEEKIHISMNVKISEHVAVRDIDLVAILANIVENAIHGCLHSGKSRQEICILIDEKGNKIAIQCKNTCTQDVQFHKGLPKSAKEGSVGVRSIVKVVSYYNGETDFFTEDGMFVARVLINIPQNPSIIP